MSDCRKRDGNRLRVCAAWLVLAVSGAALVNAASGAELTAEEKKQGFVSMFNGKDFKGWRFSGKNVDPDAPPKNWSVEGGVIKLSGGSAPHLASAKVYADFEMRFEWRSVGENYNSGFYIRSGENLGANQINLAKGGEGALLGGKVEGAKKVPELQKPPKEWNEWRIVVQGDTAAFFCNGKEAWSGKGLSPAKGYVGLQAEGAAMEFRNLRIREIK